MCLIFYFAYVNILFKKSFYPRLSLSQEAAVIGPQNWQVDQRTNER